jgi:hypothetical protein
LKTQIITLESHDDLVSVRDKLSWARTPRILLVWPKYEKVTLRLLDLKVLQRHADALGSQLGLVTRRSNVRRDAESLDIPVFDSTAAAQKDLWPALEPRSVRVPRPPRRDLRKVRDAVYEREPAWRTSLPGRILAFTAGVLGVLAIAGIFLPRATITLYLESQTQSALIPVSASPSIKTVSITGSVPAQALSVIVSGESSLAVTNEVSVPRTKAKGAVRFTNISDGEVAIPAGTVLSTQDETPIRYVTLQETLLESGTDEFVDVPIEALQPGSSGNMPVNSIVVVEGPINVKVAVTNPGLIAGGTDEKILGASQDERAELREVALDNLRRDAETKLRAQITPSDIFLPDTFEVVRVMGETYDPPIGEAGKTLILNIQAEFSALYVSADDLGQLSSSTLDVSVPVGYDPSGAVIFDALTEPSTDHAGVTHFELEASRMLLRDTETSQVFSLVRGYIPASIKDDLMQSLSLRQEPDILLTPSWWPWMPLIPFNISVETK